MRWRLFLIFTAVTAAFCFMLLTAVTDYGDGVTTYQSAPLISAARPQPVPAVTVSNAPVAAVQTSFNAFMPAPPKDVKTVGYGLAPYKFDPHLKPKSAQFFVAHNSDLVAARAESERDLDARRAKTPVHKRIRSDENGWHREEMALVTAYCPCAKCCGIQAQGITSIGKSAWTPGLATDPECLDYGTRVAVPGYGLSVIDDTGGAMRRHWREDGLLHIDVRMTYHYEARKWGKKFLKVKIYQDD